MRQRGLSLGRLLSVFHPQATLQVTDTLCRLVTIDESRVPPALLEAYTKALCEDKGNPSAESCRNLQDISRKLASDYAL